jgi:hypothetical protein
MSITLTQRVNEINIENAEDMVAIEIKYSGSFVGEVLGNTITGMNNNKIIIGFLSPPSETLMTYYGNFKIISIKAFDKTKTRVGINKIIITDELGNISSKWSESTTTYENYNQTNKYIPKTKSLIASTLNNEKRYADINGSIPENKLKLNDKKMINRIRSNYGVK